MLLVGGVCLASLASIVYHHLAFLNTVKLNNLSYLEREDMLKLNNGYRELSCYSLLTSLTVLIVITFTDVIIRRN